MHGAPSKMRVRNDRAALQFIIDTGTVSRSELEREIALSKPAVAELLIRLERAGLIEKAGKRESGPGPRAQLWTLRGGAGYAAAADVRDHIIDVAIVDLAGIQRARITRELGDDSPVALLRSCLDDACSAAGIERESDLAEVVLGVPGGIDPSTGMLEFTPRLPTWEGVDLVSTLNGELDVPVVIENDVNLMALAEVADGGVGEVDDFALLWLDAIGIGSAVVLDRRLRRGARGGAGEIDFLPIPARWADAVPAGHAPTLGAILREEALLTAAAAGGLDRGSVRDVIASAAATSSASADSTAAAFLRDLAARIAVGVASISAVMDPQKVILAGGYADAGGRVLLDLVEEELTELLTPARTASLRWALQAYTEDSALAGAIRLSLSRARERVFANGSLTEDATAG